MRPFRRSRNGLRAGWAQPVGRIGGAVAIAVVIGVAELVSASASMSAPTGTRRGVRVRRGVGDDGHRRVGERQQRHGHERDLGGDRQVRQGAAVQRHQRAGHDPRRGLAAPDHRDDARGVGQPVDRQRQLARRHLQGQRQLLPRGNLDQRLAAPTPGMIAGGSYADAFGTAALAANTWSLPRRDLRRRRRCASTSTAPRSASTAHTGHDHHLHQPAADRRRQHLRPVLRRPDRRSPRLQHRPHRRPDPDRRSHPDRRRLPSAPGNLTANAVSATEVDLSWGASTAQRRHRLPGRALPGRRLHQLHPDRDADRHQLQGHQRQRQHQLQLPRPRGRLRRQPRPLLERRDGDDQLAVTPDTAVLTFTRTAAVHRAGPWQRKRDLVGRRRRRRQRQRRHDHALAASTRRRAPSARTPSPQRRGLRLPTRPST